mmetsp:Transcript_9021/g.27975  ORF Transcript_9021/g.27975 Transcript_9021/m.27975 type:complete len:260 (-) Transcript_9021:940-1719(-)
MQATHPWRTSQTTRYQSHSLSQCLPCARSTWRARSCKACPRAFGRRSPTYVCSISRATPMASATRHRCPRPSPLLLLRSIIASSTRRNSLTPIALTSDLRSRRSTLARCRAHWWQAGRPRHLHQPRAAPGPASVRPAPCQRTCPSLRRSLRPPLAVVAFRAARKAPTTRHGRVRVHARRPTGPHRSSSRSTCKRTMTTTGAGAAPPACATAARRMARSWMSPAFIRGLAAAAAAASTTTHEISNGLVSRLRDTSYFVKT